MARGGVDGAMSWLAGAARVLQKEVRELRGSQAPGDDGRSSASQESKVKFVEHHEDMMDGMLAGSAGAL